jgi:hypothetical protein
MILILSNRTINLDCKGPDRYEPFLNPVGAENVVLATAQLAPSGDWLVSLVPSPPRAAG